MEALDAIFSRKSIRSYTGEKLTKEQIQTLVEAAYAAPVGMGQFDQVHVTVVTDEAFLKDLDVCTAELFGDPSLHPLYGAPALIIISTKQGELDSDLQAANAAMIVHNMALAAVAQDLGQVSIYGAMNALRQSEELIERLQLPENYIPAAALAVGKSDIAYEKREIPAEKISTNYIG